MKTAYEHLDLISYFHKFYQTVLQVLMPVNNSNTPIQSGSQYIKRFQNLCDHITIAFTVAYPASNYKFIFSQLYIQNFLSLIKS